MTNLVVIALYTVAIIPLLRGITNDTTQERNLSAFVSNTSDLEQVEQEGNKSQGECEKYGFRGFRCLDGECIYGVQRCDTKENCEDGSDEVGCAAVKCEDSEFRCASGKCIPNSWVCDRTAECPGEDDEDNCTLTRCNEHSNRCNNSKCSDPLLFCESVDDCVKYSDERICESSTPCPQRMFRCGVSSMCVNEHYRCDRHLDCPDGEDEAECDLCEDDEFQTNIRSKSVCDKDGHHCLGNSDETAPQCTATKSLPTPVPRCLNQFECRSGQCLDLKLVCNYQTDCVDSSDEGPECLASCKHNGGCPQICTPTPTGPLCSCQDGYESTDKGKNCFDVNECKQRGYCSHFCNNTEGGFKCTCAKGYELQKDNRTCRAGGQSPYLLLASGERILNYSLNTRNHDVEVVLTDHTAILDLDIDVQTGSICWVAAANKSYLLKTQQLKMENVLANLTLDVAIDWISRNIYYCSYPSLNISVCPLANLKDCANILKAGDRFFTSLALAPLDGFMFWTLLKGQGQGLIVRAWLDGQHRHVIVDSRLEYTSGLVVDHVLNRIYWVDPMHDKIESANYDGRDRTLVVRRPAFDLKFIAIFEDFVYWSEGWENSKIVKCNKFNCQHPQEIHTNIRDMSDMRIVHDVTQPISSNPCANSSCRHICVPTPESYSCLYPDNMTGQSDNVEASPKSTNYPAVACNFCKNGGTCLVIDSNFTCACADGFESVDCSLMKTDTHSSSTIIIATVVTVVLLIIVIAALVLLGRFYYKRSQEQTTFRDPGILYDRDGQQCLIVSSK